MFEFKLPDVGEGMHEAEMVRWLVGPGDRVKVDQPILEIQTDKAIVEIPSPVAGIVGELRFAVGQVAHVGDVLITFETEAVRPSVPPNRPASNGVAALSNTNGKALASIAATGPNGLIERKPGAVRAAPAVRKRAFELEIDLRQVPPSSPDGRVLLSDVESFAARRTTPAAVSPSPVVDSADQSTGMGSTALPAGPIATGQQSEERKALVGLRRRIAERMEQSWRTIPHATAFAQADATQLLATRASLQEAAGRRGTKLTLLPLIVKAVVQTLKEYPAFNASLDEQTREIVYKHYYHIGIATATPDGLLVPVIREADHQTLLELATEINRLSEGGRNRRLKPSELSGSTFTISNVGSYAGSYGTAIINPPESAILAVGRATEGAVVQAGQIVIRSMLPLSLSFDHRLIDGSDAGAFLAALRERLENPNLLLLEAI